MKIFDIDYNASNYVSSIMKLIESSSITENKFMKILGVAITTSDKFVSLSCYSQNMLYDTVDADIMFSELNIYLTDHKDEIDTYDSVSRLIKDFVNTSSYLTSLDKELSEDDVSFDDIDISTTDDICIPDDLEMYQDY